tara:strand:+ start:184 stop:498 length:315 start_codon:yes stop_codon:yes gene_type:complete
MSKILKPSAKKYLAYMETTGEFEFFDKYDDAKKWIEEDMIIDGLYSQESPENCGIYRLDTGIQITVTATKEDFTKEEWEDETSHMQEDVSGMWRHEFVKMPITN